MLKGIHSMPDRDERIAIWNSSFKLAWSETKAVFETGGQKSSAVFGALPILSDEEHHVLAAVVLCNLAIEARANHLIEDLVEQKRITKAVGRAAQHMPPKHRWFLIPTLAGMKTSLSPDKDPHRAIVKLCDLRNSVMHVNYEELKDKLPAQADMLSYFRNFVNAMEDMNVTLGKGDRTEPKPEVLRLGQFQSQA
jgi:hypothetical protein